MPDIRDLVSEFTKNIAGFVEKQVFDRARNTVAAALQGVGGKRGAGLASKKPLFGVRTRRKGSIQLCPVPGCKNRAAPVYGMVCAKHKDVAKAKIKKYRAARRVAKLRAKHASTR